MAEILSKVIGKEIEFEEQSLEEIRNQFEDMATMYEWFIKSRFPVNISNLKTEYPEIKWKTFANDLNLKIRICY